MTAIDVRASARSLAAHISSAWSAMRWPTLFALGASVFVLGYVGFGSYFDEIGVSKSTLDLAYLTIQLFTLESGSIPANGAPWQLEVARFSAPATLGTAVAAAAAVAFRDQLTEWRLRHERNHVVVCGLGLAGTQLVAALLDGGHRVVAIERDPTLPAGRLAAAAWCGHGPR